MTTSSPALIIGSAAADHLSLRPVRRSLPQASDSWDGNWLVVQVAVRAGAFRARFEADLRAGDFVGFGGQLKALQQRLGGEAEFTTLEEWVSVRLVGDGLGHLEVRCEVTDAPGIGSRLTFGLHLDQTYIPAMLEALEVITASFPVIGESGG